MTVQLVYNLDVSNKMNHQLSALSLSYLTTSPPTMSIASTPNFFLTRVGDELALHQDAPAPLNLDAFKKRILVIGGGVTGFTVSGFNSTSLFYA